MVQRQRELAVLVVEILLLTQLVHDVVALPVQRRDVREDRHIVHVKVICVHVVREVVIKMHSTDCVEVLSTCAEILGAHRQQRVIGPADDLQLVVRAHAVVLISQIVQEYLFELFGTALEIAQNRYLFVEEL